MKYTTKIKDFATQMGVSDRQIQRLVKKYEAELSGKIERRGQNGTWLSDEACDFLRSKMKTNPTVVSDRTLLLEKERLEAEAKKMHEQIEGLQAFIIKLQQEKEKLALADKEVKMLQEYRAEDKARIAELQEQNEADKSKIVELQEQLGCFEKSLFGFYRKREVK